MINLTRLKKGFRSWLGDWLAHRGFLKERLVIHYINRYVPPTYTYNITQDPMAAPFVDKLFEDLKAFNLQDRVSRPSARVQTLSLKWPALLVHVDFGKGKFQYWYDYADWGSKVSGFGPKEEKDGDLCFLANIVKEHGQFNPEPLEGWERNTVPELEVKTIGRAPRQNLFSRLPEVMGVSQGPGGTYLHCASWPGEASWETILQTSPRVIKPVLPDPGEIPWGKILLEW